MNQKEAVEFLPIVQALADGKPIEVLDCDGTWSVNRDLYFDKSIKCYRIKPEPKYRPFANAEECWVEMQKHQPFGWIKSKDDLVKSKFIHINSIRNNEVLIFDSYFNYINYTELNKFYTFVDGTPFGIKE